MSNYYNKEKLRRSLGHFVLGKASGALVGVATLLLLVRVLTVADYGLYVALVAYLEIFNVVSHVGLGVLSERLVPEVRASGDEARLRRLIQRLLLLRTAVVLAFSLAAAGLAVLLAPRLGLAHQVTALLLFQAVVAFETVARYCETIFDSLLMQGLAQLSLVSRTSLRLALLAWVWLGPGQVDLSFWFLCEALSYGTGLAITLGLMRRAVAGLPRTHTGPVGIRAVLRPSMQIYASQVLGAFVGIDTVKILVWRSASAEAAAVFGFSASLAWMVQRYLPSYLLVGMVRPLIVAAAAAGREGASRLAMLVSIMLKINLLLVGALVLVMLTVGDLILGFMSAGKFASATPLVVCLLLFVLSNSVRAIYSHVAMARGRGGAMLSAQVAAAAALLVGGALQAGLGPTTGSAGFALALILMNATWCAVVLRALHQAGELPALHLRPLLALAAVCAALALAGAAAIHRVGADTALLQMLVGICVLFFYFAAALPIRLFDAGERGVIINMLPNRWRNR